MTFSPDTHHRRSIRLQGYDYSQAGAYFITLCVHDRECLFGKILDEQMRINQFGRIIEAEWIRLGELREEIELGESVVMPNHFHGILIFKDNITSNSVGAIHELPLPVRQQRRIMALPKIIGRFKMMTAKRINETRETQGLPVWQRNYYEHVIRDEADYNRIAEYVATNPQQWIEDKMYPDNIVAEIADHTATDHRAAIVGATIVGAIHELPLRTVPRPGGNNGK